jgi:hypothetical protein
MKLSIFMFSLLTFSSTWADAVWHCSRNSMQNVSENPYIQENNFSIASVNASNDAIGISITDLIDIYSGVPVRIGGLALSACYSQNDEILNTSALSSLGLQTSVIQALARKSSIVQNNLYFVAAEEQMLKCIEKHFPAVGYLDESTETETVKPCF